jgi:hypothetical protein
MDNPGLFSIYRDPYPVTALHQWYTLDSFFVDTLQKTLRFKYFHPRYVVLDSSLTKAKIFKANIASTGYPFEYGIFYGTRAHITDYSPSISQTVRLFPNPATQRIFLVSGPDAGRSLNALSSAGIYSLDGRCVRQWSGAELIKGMDISNISQGRYIIKMQIRAAERSTFHKMTIIK